ncbi:MAG TPA: malic enzyme-like NAD(P)-binding protein, partial [Acidimicrobiales bacterium]|nr:malic enzyme-like NAD(P)-binding protein [Acidimicrobiales bacterium]
INNSLCFPGFFRGALSARASYVTQAMKQAATRAIAACVTDEELGLGVIVPSMFQPRVHEQVAAAVAQAWASEHPAAPEGPGAAFPTWSEPE